MNPIEKAFYTGIGLALKSVELVEEAAAKLVEDSKMSSEEGKRFIAEAVGSAEQTRKEMTAKIEEVVRAALAKAGMAKNNEIDELKERIANLEAEVERLKGN
jgi:polyhydroxyalkanoate synthesis regulator phasin